MCLQGPSGTTAEMTMQPAKLNPGRTKKVPCIAETPVKWPEDFLYLFCDKTYAAMIGNGTLGPTFLWCSG